MERPACEENGGIFTSEIGSGDQPSIESFLDPWHHQTIQSEMIKKLLSLINRDKEKISHEYVMIEDDGSARELTESECAYLDGDSRFGAYVKSTYTSKDGWGKISGFLEKSKLPPEIVVNSFDEIDEAAIGFSLADVIKAHISIGDEVNHGEDGSILVTPNRSLTSYQRLKAFRNALHGGE